jgi:hypothetical protein
MQPLGLACLSPRSKLTGRMQFAIWELVEERSLRSEPVEVRLAE